MFTSVTSSDTIQLAAPARPPAPRTAPGAVLPVRAILLLAILPAMPPSARAEWKVDSGCELRESYDSNVFLQDQAPDPAIAGAVPARHASLQTMVAARVGLTHQLAPETRFSFAYLPEAVWFHSAASENHSVHRTSLNLQGRPGPFAWELKNNAAWTDGSHEAPVFGGPGGAPALGGAPVRDRRAAFVDRGAFRLSGTHGPWLGRVLATAYLHDFRTAQRRTAGYANYIDRSELLAGGEVGREIRPGTWLIAGYRGGRQQQYRLHGTDSPYDSTLHRFVAGLEGTPWTWLKRNLLAGPEIRRFAPGTPAGFDRSVRPLWVDATATFVLSGRQTCTLAFRRQSQPSASSFGIYDDIVCDAAWRWRIGGHLAATAGLKLARGDWQAPAVREDRIVTPSLLLQLALGPRHSLELGWSFDRALSRVPGTSAREFRHHLVSLDFKISP